MHNFMSLFTDIWSDLDIIEGKMSPVCVRGYIDIRLIHTYTAGGIRLP